MPELKGNKGDKGKKGMKETKAARASKASKNVHIRKDMPVSEIIALLPHAGPLLGQYGLHCFGCVFNGIETLAEGCRGHGFPEEDIDALVDDLNEMLHEQPVRPATLTITEAAASHLKAIAEQEGRPDDILEVVADEHGSFCLEFRDTVEKHAPLFGHSTVDLRITASVITLARIGGATIDFREERFKLDLATDNACACGKGECGCTKKD